MSVTKFPARDLASLCRQQTQASIDVVLEIVSDVDVPASVRLEAGERLLNLPAQLIKPEEGERVRKIVLELKAARKLIAKSGRTGVK